MQISSHAFLGLLSGHLVFLYRDLKLLQRVKERFDLDGEIVLQKYNDSWGDWVDVSCPKICLMDKIEVVRLAEPHKVCLLSFVVPCDFFLQNSFIERKQRPFTY